MPDMSNGKITIDRRGRVLLIGIDRAAKRNAFDIAMYDELGRAYAQLERDDEVFCGVLHAHGAHFTGGLDLPSFAGAFSSGAMPVAADGVDPLGLTGAARKKPIVAAAQGICFTIGIELLLATDIRIAARDVRFGQIEIKRAIYPVGGATIRLPRECGWGNAMRWLLTGGEFGADEALRIGFVQEVVDTGQQLESAIQLAEEIAAQAPLGVYATIASARIATLDGEREAARRLLPDLQPLLQSSDMQEGLASFMERRPGRFTGK
jgi:enoyl-CoA hydratase/carnithine racemase